MSMDPTVQGLLERNKYCFTLSVSPPLALAESFIKTVRSECFTSAVPLGDLIGRIGTTPRRYPSVSQLFQTGTTY